MSILSAMWSRNKHILNPIAKAVVARIPIAGDVLSSRISMSPDQNQAALTEATSTALARIETAAQPLMAAPSSLPPAPPLFGASGSGAGLSSQQLLLLIGGAVVVVVLLNRRN